MLDKIKEYMDRVEAFQASTAEELENFRVKYLGKKGVLNELFEEFKKAPAESKREIGQRLNQLKNKATERVSALREEFEAAREQSSAGEDLSRPALTEPIGSRHPISEVRRQVVDIFSRIGFTIADGPEIEDDWHNFTALNLPQHHPARDMQDTFYVENASNVILRSQTSGAQIHAMEGKNPPIRVIAPGRVYRNESVNARKNNFFHQIEGLYVDKDITFGDLKGVLNEFIRIYFGASRPTRFRNSFFPFTEPSAEVDVQCIMCEGKGCRTCSGTGWLEILGSGMVDPNVLKNVGIDPDVYSGFAFGMGVERLAMLKYAVDDIRLFFNNDERFLKQF